MSVFADISIVIPSYNARRHLDRCLRTLAREVPGAELIVVDGESADGSAELVEAEYPHVILRRCKNHGWSHATNRGIEVATRPYLLLLNSDAFPMARAVVAMMNRLKEKPNLGAVAPTLQNEDGSRQSVFGLWYWPNLTKITRPTEVPVVSAACVMTTRERFDRVGAFDENFFFYNEELDWCRRAKDAGFKLELLPESVIHVGGGSTSPNPLLRLETQRAFVYLSEKHWPSWVTGMLRSSMLMEAWVGKHIDPRPEHRKMWERLESTMGRRAYLESPFNLSGRGTPDLSSESAKK